MGIDPATSIPIMLQNMVIINKQGNFSCSHFFNCRDLLKIPHKNLKIK